MRLTSSARPAPANVAADRRRRERRRLAFGLGGVVVALLFLLLRPLDFRFAAAGPERLHCGAEQQRKEQFITAGQTFSGVEYRTGERSRNGRYAIALPADGQMHYGFSTTLEDVLPGGVYEVSVWSFDNDGSGKPAVRGSEPDGFYVETAAVERRDPNGWAEHRLRFYVPFEQPPT